MEYCAQSMDTSILGKNPKHVSHDGMWPNKAACKIQPNSRSTSPARGPILNEETVLEKFQGELLLQPVIHCFFEVSTLIGKTILKFLIDTDASVTIRPYKYANRICLNPTSVHLSSANGQEIQCYGEVSIEIDFLGLCHSYR